MKLRTRIFAWLHIVPFTGAFLIVLFLLLLGGGVLSGMLKPDHPEPGWQTAIAGLGVVALGCLILGVVLVFVLPWIFLLKQRSWAWWLLTVVYSLYMAVALIAMAYTYPAWLKLTGDEGESVGLALLWLVTLIILLTDRPPWRGKKRRKRR